MVIAISYDLNKPGQDYSRLIAAIKSLGSTIRPLKSQWFVDTISSASDVFMFLKDRIDVSDRLFVDKVTSDRVGYLDVNVVEWLKVHSN